MKALVYLDSPAMATATVAIGRALQSGLGAEIEVLLVDSEHHRDQLPESFAVRDLSELWAPPRTATGPRRSWSKRILKGLLSVLFLPLVALDPEKARDPARLVRLVRRWIAFVRIGLNRTFGFFVNPVERLLRRQPLLLRKLRILRASFRFGRARCVRFVRRGVAFIRRLLNRALFFFVNPIKRFLRRRRLVRELRMLRASFLLRRAIRSYMKRSAPDVAIFFEDNIETYTRLFIDSGQRLGIPTVIVPFTIPNAREAANALVKMSEYRVGNTMARHLSRFKSQWVLPFEGHALIRLPLSRLLGVELMGAAVPRPWILNSGSASVIALDSEASRRSYLAVNFPESQLAVVGDPTSAQLTTGLKDPRTLRERLLLTNRFEGHERPLVVCAFPPDQFRGTPADSYEHATFFALLDSWFSVLTEMSRHANVLVRPHPRLSAEMLKAYETDHLRVTWQPTAELIPAADLYVASISATIRWAIACGIPVINYDCYRYRYDDFVEARGVVTVYSEADFSDTATRFFDDAAFAQDLREKQRAVMGDWGMVDGRFAQRFAALVAKIVAPAPCQSAREAA